MKKIGFIGCGNMASAMITGIISSKLLHTDDIVASNSKEESAKKNSQLLNIDVVTDNTLVAKNCEIVILAVKPNLYKKVCEEIKNCISSQTIVVSIAAGQTIENIESLLGNDKKIIRCMPNTPAMVLCGMTAICGNSNTTDNDINCVKGLFSTFSDVEVVEEKLFGAVIGLSGSSPAYVDIFIEAMADAGVIAGMKRNQAYKFAAKAVMGSAKMVLDSGKHPAELKDMVCSPSGTTIEAVKVLEEKGFRGTVIDAICACVDKSNNM